MRIIESIRNYLLTCPLLNDSRVNIDWLGAETAEYSIDGSPVNPIVKRYADGGTVRQFNFVFSSVEAYGQDVLNNIENSGFYEDFAEWLEKQNKAQSLPKMDNGRKAISIEALNTGYLFENTADRARYQIQCRLLYYMDY